MARVLRFPFEALQRLRRLNGVIPIHPHPSLIGDAMNAVFGIQEPYLVMFPEGITVDADIRFNVPVIDPCDNVKVDVLGYAIALGSYNVDFVSATDATGVRLRFNNNVNGLDPSPAAATWRTTGYDEGDAGSGGVPTARSLGVAADANGFASVNMVGSANVKIYAVQFVPVPVETVS